VIFFTETQKSTLLASTTYYLLSIAKQFENYSTFAIVATALFYRSKQTSTDALLAFYPLIFTKRTDKHKYLTTFIHEVATLF
jgi:hypothetical protein